MGDWFGGEAARFLSRGGSAPVGIAEILLVLSLAFVLGQLVAWTYMWTQRGLSFSRQFVRSLLLICMIVAMVMLTVGDSLARAFGLVGALAIVRFRTAVRDTQDIAFVFLALAAGIACGSRHYMAALMGTPVICAAAAWLKLIGAAEQKGAGAFLRLRMQSGDDAERTLHSILKQFCSSYSLVSVSEEEGQLREQSFQLEIFDIRLRDRLMGALVQVPGASGVDLLMQQGAETA